jgi:spore maturation protein CgeB
MTAHLRALRDDPELRALASPRSGLETIRARHTCAHRVDELLGIVARSEGQAARLRSRPAGQLEVDA